MRQGWSTHTANKAEGSKPDLLAGVTAEVLLPVGGNDSQSPFRRGTALFKCCSRYSHRHTAYRRQFSCMSRFLFRLRCYTSSVCRPLPGSAVPQILLGDPGVPHRGNTWICWWHGWSLLPAQAHSVEVHNSEQTATGPQQQPR